MSRHARLARRWILTFVICTAAIAAASSAAVPQSTPSYSSDGPGLGRGYFSGLPFERIDMSTGNLLLNFTDLVLPGNAGMDLRVERVFSKAKGGWQIGLSGFPLWITDPDGYFNPETGETRQAKAVTFDAVAHVLYPVDSIFSSTVWVSEEFWKYTPADRTVRLPSGWVAHYLPSESPARLDYVEDPFGNRIEVEWSNQTGEALQMTEARQVPSGGSGQARTIAFAYDLSSCGRPRTMSFSGRAWTYGYAYCDLRSVDGPEGQDWTYNYLEGDWHVVTTPNGGEAQYHYQAVQFPDDPAEPQGKWHRVVDRRRTGGRDIPPGEWTFTYDVANLPLVTRVVTPTNRTLEYTHRWWYESRYSLSKVRVLDQANEVGRLDREFTLRRVTDYSDAIPLVSEEIRQQDGRTLTTTFEYLSDDASSHYGDYHRAFRITEQGDLTRLTALTFDYNFAANLGAIERTHSRTVTVAGESFATSAEYEDATGFHYSATEFGITTTFGRDSAGNRDRVTDGAGHETTTLYDWGVPGTVTTPEYTIYRTINPDGTLAEETQFGATTHFTYDALGRVTRVTPPEGDETVTSYASDGRSVTVSRGPTWTTTTLDGFGRPSGSENAEGIKTAVSYDVEGRKDFQSFPFQTGPAAGETFAYDALGRVTRVTHPGGAFVQYTYSGGNVTVTDENGHATTQEWAAFGDPADARLVALTDANNQRWVYSYNALGRLTRVHPPEGPDRVWQYNGANQLETDSQPESGTTTYTYHADGLLYTKTDGLSRLSRFYYDGNHRLTTIDIPGTADGATFEYDDRDNRTRATVAGVDSFFSYDWANRLRGREDRIGPEVFVSQYEYDARDNLWIVTYPSGREVRYAYDAADRITRVSAGAQTYADGIAYHPSGGLAGVTFGNGTVEGLTVDGRSRPEHLTSGPLDLTYAYDPVGNVTGITDPRPTFSATYGYDALDRLETVTGFGATTFTYDAQGNRRTKGSGASLVTYHYDDPATNRLTSATSALGPPETGTSAYDPVGNLRFVTGDQTATYTYATRNLMTSATMGTGPTTTYAYDADGLRTVKTTPSGTQYFLHGPGSHLLAEYDGTSGVPALTREYVYLGGKLLTSLAPSAPATQKAQLVSPAVNATLTGTTATFAWTPGVGVAFYWLYIGSTPGTWDILSRDMGATGLSTVVTNLPADGRTLYVRVLSHIGSWQSLDYTLTAVSPRAELTAPAPGSTLTSSTAAFAWTPGIGVAFYWLYIGSTPGTWDILSRDMGATGLSTVVTNLPNDGRTLYVRLHSHIDGVWQYHDYVLTAVMAERAVLTSPTPGSTLTGTTATFAWTPGVDVAFYWLYIGSTPGTWDILSRDMGATGLSTVVTGLPSDGRMLYVRLFSHIGVWQYHDDTLTAFGGDVAWVAPDQAGGGTTQFPPEPKPPVVRAPKIAPSPVPPPDGATSTDGGGMAAMASGPVTWIATLVGTGTGTVTSTPSGLTCTGGEVSCAGTFDAGTPVTFTATSGSGSTFGGWAGACTGMASTCPVTITEAQTVIAIFTGPPAVTYYHTDILGSVRAITDAAGAVLTRHDYFPFGESTSPLPGDPRRFTGKELDPETALHYFDARYYRNLWGRFTTADDSIYLDLANPQSFNLYAYTLNNPLRWVDPTGHQAAPLRFTDSITVTAKESDCFVLCNPDIDSVFYDWFGKGLRNREAILLRRGPLPFNKMAEQVGTFLNSPAVQVLAAAPHVNVIRLGGRLALLGKYFASEAGLAQLMRGGGRTIIGPGTRQVLDEAARLARQYGGAPERWVKVTSTVPGQPQIHAYRNLDSGLTVELKTIIR